MILSRNLKLSRIMNDLYSKYVVIHNIFNYLLCTDIFLAKQLQFLMLVKKKKSKVYPLSITQQLKILTVDYYLAKVSLMFCMLTNYEKMHEQKKIQWVLR